MPKDFNTYLWFVTAINCLWAISWSTDGELNKLIKSIFIALALFGLGVIFKSWAPIPFVVTIAVCYLVLFLYWSTNQQSTLQSYFNIFVKYFMFGLGFIASVFFLFNF